MKLNELLRHMNTHKDVASLTDGGRKRVFKQRVEQLCAKRSRDNLSQGSNDFELFSYKAAYIVAIGKRPYVEGEIVIKPVLQSFVRILGEVFQKTVRDAITGVALSNNTITRRIESMGRIWENRFTTIFVLHLIQPWPSTSPLILRQKHSQWRTQKVFMRGVHSVAYGGHLYLVCAVCNVTIWRHIHVSKPTFWRNLLT